MQLDKKHMPEYVGTMEATIEIQSLQIIGFLSMVRNKIALFCGVQFESHTLNLANKLSFVLNIGLSCCSCNTRSLCRHLFDRDATYIQYAKAINTCTSYNYKWYGGRR